MTSRREALKIKFKRWCERHEFAITLAPVGLLALLILGSAVFSEKHPEVFNEALNAPSEASGTGE